MEHIDHKKKIVIMVAIMSAMLFASLNQTIIGTALPRIISELGGMEYFSWVFTMFMLTSSITAILVGKLSDIYGRKLFILIGIGVFIAGSFLCGTSDTIIQLIAYRGVQGFGAGMIMSTSFTAVGDLFSPRERGKWQGLMSSIFGLASVFGPTLGGWIVDNADWHWVFWVFLPVGIVAFAMIYFLFPSQAKRETEKVDYAGSIFLTLTIIPLLLVFTWGGKDYDWTSLPILGLLAGTIVALVIFILIEKRAASPVLPLNLFKNNIFTLSNVIGFILGGGMFGVIMYMPFFIQGVIGTSATKSGFIMMPMTLSMVAASAICGQLMTKTGKYKRFALIGLFIMAAGMVMMSFMDEHTSNAVVLMNNIIAGFGLGMSFPVFTLTVQNAVEHRLLGVATASSQLFRQIGGTVGVAVMGTVMNYKLGTKMAEIAKEEGIESLVSGGNPDLLKLENPQILMNPGQLAELKAALPPEMQPVIDQVLEMVREALGYSLTYVFLVGASVIAVGFLLTFLLKEIPLRQSNVSPVSEKEKHSASGE